MSRYVDTVPAPEKPLEVKVVVLSYSRNATLGLYTALGMLGYKAYHVKEIFKNGVPHMEMTSDAIQGAQTGQGRYSRADYDKWLADYDAIVEIACFDLLDDIVAYYPNAKFILTTRDSRAWMKSMNKTITPAIVMQSRFPFTVLRRLDKYMAAVSRISECWRYVFFPGGDLKDEEGAMRKYEAYNERVQQITPPEKLLHVRLEDGLGWEQVCPFLGHEVPDQPYPRVNDAAQFEQNRKSVQNSNLARIAMQTAAVVLPPLIGVALFTFIRNRK